VQASSLGAGVALSGGSIVLASTMASGAVSNTIASHVTTGECNANGCMLINVTAKKIQVSLFLVIFVYFLVIFWLFLRGQLV
jgi:hypothetical protein